MIKTKKGLRQKSKLTGLADTEPSVTADFTNMHEDAFTRRDTYLHKDTFARRVNLARRHFCTG